VVVVIRKRILFLEDSKRGIQKSRWIRNAEEEVSGSINEERIRLCPLLLIVLGH
jgi:hypothetical protein